MQRMLYPIGQIIVADGKAVHVKPYKVYQLDAYGVRFFSALANSCSYQKLREFMQIQTQAQKNTLDVYIDKAIKEQLIAEEYRPGGEIFIRNCTEKNRLERVFVEVTEKCNFNCQHCYMSADSNVDISNELTTSELKDIITQAVDAGAFRMDFTGGELFVRPDIQEVLQFAADHGMVTNLFTNGYALTKKMCDFLQALRNIRIVFISLDDVSAIAHDSFRGKSGAFDRVVRAIEYLKARDIRPVVNITLNQHNADRIQEVIDYCRESLAVECRVAPVMYIGRGKCFEQDPLSEEIISFAMTYTIGNQISSHRTTTQQGSTIPGCGVGTRMVYIKADGEVCLCPTLSSRESDEFMLGNIRNQSLSSIWNTSDKLENFRAQNCVQSDCEFFNQCCGGCRSRAFFQARKLNDKDNIVCNYFAMQKKIFYTNPQCKFKYCGKIPMAILPGKKLIPLTSKQCQFLFEMKDGASLYDAMCRMKKIESNGNVICSIQRLIREDILIEKKKYIWKANSFGAELYGEDEANALEAVIKSKTLCRNNIASVEQLPYMINSSCELFESNLSKKLKVRHVLCVNSGTSAIECALRALGINKAEDEVLVPCYGYIGTAAAVLNVGATPVLCDIDERLFLDANRLEEKITAKTRAIICVYVRGMAGDIVNISDIAKRHNLKLIEDCAQAIGTRIDGQSVGTFGDVGCFSFHEHKLVSAGEGGAIITNDTSLFDRMYLIHDASRILTRPDLHPGFPGGNMRMTELQAGIGIVQLERIDEQRKHLRDLYQVIYDNLNDVPGLGIMELLDGDIPLSVFIECDTPAVAWKLSNQINELGVPAILLYDKTVPTNSVYAFWPYILELDENTSGTANQLYKRSLARLSRTIGISLGMHISKEMVSELCKDILAGLCNNREC